MLCVFGVLPSLGSNSSDCKDCRTVLFGSVLVWKNLTVFDSIITNCDDYLFRSYVIQYQSLRQMYRQFHCQQSHLGLRELCGNNFGNFEAAWYSRIIPE